MGHVDAETVDAAIEPKAQSVIELLDDIWMVPMKSGWGVKG